MKTNPSRVLEFCIGGACWHAISVCACTFVSQPELTVEYVGSKSNEPCHLEQTPHIAAVSAPLHHNVLTDMFAWMIQGNV